MFLKAAPKADYIYKKEKETYFTIVSGKAFSPGRPGSVLTSSSPDPARDPSTATQDSPEVMSPRGLKAARGRGSVPPMGRTHGWDCMHFVLCEALNEDVLHDLCMQFYVCVF